MLNLIEGKKVVIWTGDGPLNTSETSGHLMGVTDRFFLVDDGVDLHLVNIDKVRVLKVLGGSGSLGDPYDIDGGRTGQTISIAG